jgi:hypothetical protein
MKDSILTQANVKVADMVIVRGILEGSNSQTKILISNRPLVKKD